MNNTGNTVYEKIINNKKITKLTINKTLEKNTDFSSKVKYMSFFYKKQSCSGSNIENALKIKQLANQTPTLKTPLQKNLVEL